MNGPGEAQLSDKAVCQLVAREDLGVNERSGTKANQIRRCRGTVTTRAVQMTARRLSALRESISVGHFSVNPYRLIFRCLLISRNYTKFQAHLYGSVFTYRLTK